MKKREEEGVSMRGEAETRPSLMICCLRIAMSCLGEGRIQKTYI